MLNAIQNIVAQAGELILSAKELDVQEKTGHKDLVTKYDCLVQQKLETELTALLPGSRFLGEENAVPPDMAGSTPVWIVDPIDGTTNFIQGFPNSAISVGLWAEGDMALGVVYNPYTGEMYAAQRGKGATLGGRPIHVKDKPLTHSLLLFGSGLYYRELTDLTLRIFSAAFPLAQDVRRFGSAALDYCYLAAGKAGAFFEARLCPWDSAAGSLIAREAGAIVTALDGGPLDLTQKCSVLAGCPMAYADMERLLQAIPQVRCAGKAPI